MTKATFSEGVIVIISFYIFKDNHIILFESNIIIINSSSMYINSLSSTNSKFNRPNNLHVFCVIIIFLINTEYLPNRINKLIFHFQLMQFYNVNCFVVQMSAIHFVYHCLIFIFVLTLKLIVPVSVICIYLFITCTFLSHFFISVSFNNFAVMIQNLWNLESTVFYKWRVLCFRISFVWKCHFIMNFILGIVIVIVVANIPLILKILSISNLLVFKFSFFI